MESHERRPYLQRRGASIDPGMRRRDDLSPGTLELRFMMPQLDGRPKRKSVTGKSPAQLRRRKAQMLQQGLLTVDDVTVNALLDAWLDEREYVDWS